MSSTSTSPDKLRSSASGTEVPQLVLPHDVGIKSIPPLTPEQQTRLQAWREEWFRHSQSTAPADQALAEHGISKLYALMGRGRPRFVWVDSPLQAQAVIHFLNGVAKARRTARSKPSRVIVPEQRLETVTLGESLREELDNGGVFRFAGVRNGGQINKALRPEDPRWNSRLGGLIGVDTELGESLCHGILPGSRTRNDVILLEGVLPPSALELDSARRLGYLVGFDGELGESLRGMSWLDKQRRKLATSGLAVYSSDLQDRLCLAAFRTNPTILGFLDGRATGVASALTTAAEAAFGAQTSDSLERGMVAMRYRWPTLMPGFVDELRAPAELLRRVLRNEAARSFADSAVTLWKPLARLAQYADTYRQLDELLGLHYSIGIKRAFDRTAVIEVIKERSPKTLRETIVEVGARLTGLTEFVTDPELWSAVVAAIPERPNYVSTWHWGQMDAYWVSYYRFCEQLGVTFEWNDSEALSAHELVAKSCAWWWPYAEVCIVCERPKAIRWDADGNLHCDDGPAVAFRDGWGIYAIGGVVLTKQIIEAPETMTVQQIKDERNVEVRRIMRERYGEGRYLADIGAKVIDVDSVPVDKLVPSGHHIHRALLEDDEGQRFLVGSDGSTKRCYYMQVPRDTQTCRDAYQVLASGWDESNCLMEC